MDAQEHFARIEKVREWFAGRDGHSMTVIVHSGGSDEYVATGPFLRLEEHPTAKGVFRALFDDSLAAGSGPDAVRFVAFGSELQGVQAEDARLVLDKGAQTVEVVDRSVKLATADEVAWPAAEPPAAVPAAPPPVPVAPAAPPPVPVAPAPVAPAPAGGLTVKAPVWANSLNGSRFSGSVSVQRDGDAVSFTGTRSADSGRMLVTGGLLLVLGGIATGFGLVIAFNAQGDSDMGMAFACMGPGMLAVLTGLALYLLGRKRASEGQRATLRVPVGEIRGAKVRYDSNLGCLLSLLLSPVVGLIVMLVQGARLARMTVPNDLGKARRMNLVLKAQSAADGLRLQQLLR